VIVVNVRGGVHGPPRDRLTSTVGASDGRSRTSSTVRPDRRRRIAWDRRLAVLVALPVDRVSSRRRCQRRTRGEVYLNTLTSDDIQQFKEWRQERVKTITLKTDMTCIKGFIRFCEHIDAVPKTSG
jgi:hypothetical protein